MDVTGTPNAGQDEPSARQLALDVISLAQSAGMPDTYWGTDGRIARACATLGLDPDRARDLDVAGDGI